MTLLKTYNELANFANSREANMSTMNISLPESLKRFVDEHVAKAGYGTSSEYVRDLIRRDQDRLLLRNMLLEGATSPLSAETDSDYFSSLRQLTEQKLGKMRE